MKKILLFCLLCVPGIYIPASAQPNPVPERHLKVAIEVPKDGLSKLLEEGMEFDHGRYDSEAGTWTTIVQEGELDVLKRNAVPYEVLIDDLSRYIEENGTDALPEERNISDPNRLAFTGWECNSLNYPTPALFPYPNGSMGGFLTFAEIIAHLDLLATTYPTLITPKQSIGQSHDGRDLWVVKISDNPGQDEDEPEIFYNSLIHAREPMAAASVIFFMDYILENYATDPAIRDLVDNTEMYFLPVFNPDGYEQNYFTNPNGGGLWRKNRRLNSPGDYGVDLNRNYAHQWGINNSGSSGNTAAATYRGPSPFSEPETQAVRDFTYAREFKVVFNIHTYGEYMIHPFEYINTHPFGIDRLIYTRLGRDICQHNSYKNENTFGTLNYFVNGGANDWCYGDSVTKPKIYSFVPEVGTSFWPLVGDAAFFGAEMMYPYLKGAYVAGDYGELEDWTDAAVYAASGHFPFRFTRTGLLDSGTFTIRLIPFTGIASAGAPVVFTNLDLYDQKADSVSYTLQTGLIPGDRISFAWELDNGRYTLRDTVDKIYQPTVVFTDNCETLTNWATTGNWGMTSDAFEGTGAFTDSPTGNYSTNPNTTYLYLNQNIDLSTATDAYLTLWIKYQTAAGRDYVQIEGSRSGFGPSASGYTPLCGDLTQPSSGKDFLPAGQPIYHGDFPLWRKETIDLRDYLGSTLVGIRVKFVTTLGNINTPADGFYLDKVSLMSTNQQIPLSVDLKSFSAREIDGNVMINWETEAPLAEGSFVIERALNGPFRKIATQAVHSGIYYTHLDPQPDRNGPIHYRLAFTNTDGKTTYSHTISITLNGDGTRFVKVFPNPAREELHLSVGTQSASPVILQFSDISGRECHQVTAGPGETLSVDIRRWPRGVYFIRISGKDGVHTRKIVLGR